MFRVRVKIFSHTFFIALLCTLSSCERDKGFTVRKIAPRSQNKAWSNAGGLAEAKAALRSTFSYCGSGSHTYVFGNGTYVIKFFKQNRLNKDRDFASCNLALTRIPHLTGVVYFHPSQSNELGVTTRFIDQNGKPFALDMDTYEFFIQKQAAVGFSAVDDLIHRGEVESAFRSIASIFELVKERARAGLSDRDLQIFKNFGYIGETPIEIDIGNLQEDPSAKEFVLEQLFNIHGQLREWIDASHPHLRDRLEKLIREIDHAA